MTAPQIDLDRLEAKAQAAEDNAYANGTSLTPEFLAFVDEATPAVVLELVARLRRAEAVVDAMKSQGVTFDRRSENLNPTVRAAIDALGLGQPDPNDPLDDVLPLAAERRKEALQRAEGMWKGSDVQVGDYGLDPALPASEIDEVLPLATVTVPPTYAGPDRWRAQPKILPDNLPKSIDLDDTEGGSHD